MARFPYFRLFPSDFLGDTTGLTDAEVGNYALILMALWNAGGWMSVTQARRASRAPSNLWPKRWEHLARYFVTDEAGMIASPRLLDELARTQNVSLARTLARGAKSLKTNKPPLTIVGTIVDKRARDLKPEPERKKDCDMERKEGTQPLPTALLGEFTDEFGEAFVASWLSVASWTEHPKRTITPRTFSAFDHLRRNQRFLAMCRERDIELLEPA